MKMFKYSLVLLCVAFFASCTKDLNRTPRYGTTSVTVFSTPAGYKQALAKVYAHFALTGSSGAGSSDIRGIDAGTSSFIRMYWKLQELTTDEAVVGWNDPGLPELHRMSWSSSNDIVKGFYNRLLAQITLANEYIRESDPGVVGGKGFAAADVAEIKTYRAEARLIRAYDYLVALDLFGNVPHLTEANLIGGDRPAQINRAALFTYVENELKAVEADLKAPKANEYGRLDRAASWMSLARLYLNAKVYVGNDRYTDAITQVRKVMAAGYTLEPNYRNLFLADNGSRTNEIIFAIPFDGLRMQTFGGTTFLVHASIGGNMSPSAYGVDAAWGGLRTTPNFVDLFADPSGNTDKRAMFYTSGQNKDIADISTFTDGYAIIKWQNKTSTGASGTHPTFVDTDFPMFRLAEAYLIFAESVMRGGAGGTQAEALDRVNDLRQRAYGNTSGNLSTLSLDNILDERGKELYWEGFRRTDLIRYGKFTEANYLWQWKGGIKAGRGVESFRNLFPLPADDITANPNLKQNPGY
jgi:starch-binding outer membrane protein, SusD/RagB family